MYQEPSRTLRRITRWVHPQPPLDCETHLLVPKGLSQCFWGLGFWHLEKGSTVVVIPLLTPLELLEHVGVDEWVTACFSHSKAAEAAQLAQLDVCKTQVIQWAKPSFFRWSFR